MDETILHFNGVDGATGGYLLPPMSIGHFAERIRGRRIRPPGRAKGVAAGIDAARLEEAGWGVIFAHDEKPAIKEALRDLIEHRRSSGRCRELTRLPEERALSFLTRHGAAPGPVVPDQVPYYLLIVGDPQAIPFSFQESLDVQYAVGRLSLETPEQYARYAQSVVAAESGGVRRCPRATFFGVENPADPATELSARELVQPLAEGLAGSLPGWDVIHHSGEAASKAQLDSELCGEDLPAFLFTAGHAVYFPPTRPELQRQRQGALLMSDWPGPRTWRKPVPAEHYFAAHDLGPQARVHGLVSFHFACFSGGTPRFDAFAGEDRRHPVTPEPFVARLPQALLAHPGGGALAVVGHVDRAWDTSFFWPGAGARPAVFESTLKKILTGCPVGHAMEFFGQRYAELAVELHAAKLSAAEKPDDRLTDRLTAQLWTAYHDARGYVLLGDPAVRLATEEGRCPDPSSTPC